MTRHEQNRRRDLVHPLALLALAMVPVACDDSGQPSTEVIDCVGCEHDLRDDLDVTAPACPPSWRIDGECVVPELVPDEPAELGPEGWPCPAGWVPASVGTCAPLPLASDCPEGTFALADGECSASWTCPDGWERAESGFGCVSPRDVAVCPRGERRLPDGRCLGTWACAPGWQPIEDGQGCEPAPTPACDAGALPLPDGSCADAWACLPGWFRADDGLGCTPGFDACDEGPLVGGGCRVGTTPRSSEAFFVVPDEVQNDRALTLAEALERAQDGDLIEMARGRYELPSEALHAITLRGIEPEVRIVGSVVLGERARLENLALGERGDRAILRVTGEARLDGVRAAPGEIRVDGELRAIRCELGSVRVLEGGFARIERSTVVAAGLGLVVDGGILELVGAQLRGRLEVAAGTAKLVDVAVEDTEVRPVDAAQIWVGAEAELKVERLHVRSQAKYAMEVDGALAARHLSLHGAFIAMAVRGEARVFAADLGGAVEATNGAVMHVHDSLVEGPLLASEPETLLRVHKAWIQAEGAPDAIHVTEGAAAAISQVRLRGFERAGLWVEDGASAVAENVVIAGDEAFAAVWAEDAEVWLGGALVEGPRNGLIAKGADARLDVMRSVVRGAEDLGVLSWSGARVRLDASEVRDLRLAAVALQGRLVLDQVSLRGGETGALASRGELALTDCIVRDAVVGLESVEGTVIARRTRITEATDGVRLEGGRFAGNELVIEKGKVGLEISAGAAAWLVDVSVYRLAAFGVHVADGGLVAERLRVDLTGKAALSVGPRGEAMVDLADLGRASRGVFVSGGSLEATGVRVDRTRAGAIVRRGGRVALEAALFTRTGSGLQAGDDESALLAANVVVRDTLDREADGVTATNGGRVVLDRFRIMRPAGTGVRAAGGRVAAVVGVVVGSRTGDGIVSDSGGQVSLAYVLTRGNEGAGLAVRGGSLWAMRVESTSNGLGIEDPAAAAVLHEVRIAGNTKDRSFY